MAGRLRRPAIDLFFVCAGRCAPRTHIKTRLLGNPL